MFHVKHSSEHEMHVKPPPNKTRAVLIRRRAHTARTTCTATDDPSASIFLRQMRCRSSDEASDGKKASNSEARSRALHAPTSRRNACRTEHQVTGEPAFAFTRKACPRDGMISEFGCFLPFRASRLTKAPAKEGNPEHDAPSKEPKLLFRMQKPRKACSEGEGRTERRRRRRTGATGARRAK